MVRFDELTSRLKDHYDLWALSQIFSFRKAELVLAIRRTFENRGTPLPSKMPSPLAQAFAGRRDKLTQWDAFLRRAAPTHAPASFAETLTEVRRFLGPVIEALDRDANEISGEWTPEHGWPWPFTLEGCACNPTSPAAMSGAKPSRSQNASGARRSAAPKETVQRESG